MLTGKLPGANAPAAVRSRTGYRSDEQGAWSG